MKRSTFALSALALGLAVFAPAAPAAHHLNTTVGGTMAGAPLAVHGFDVVAYFSQKKAVAGAAKFEIAHEGATYRFANQANLDAFKKSPAQYLPQYGGFCAMGVAMGKKLDGDPNVWTVVDGKLYLNLSPEVQGMWQKERPMQIQKANTEWPKIRDKSPADLM
jgi:YHS domain-containing protein